MRIPACALLLIALAFPAAAGAADKKMPALLERARYVALGYDLGDGFVSADQIARVSGGTLTDEYRAIEAIRGDLEKWKRFIVADRPDQADILIVLRVSRRAAIDLVNRTGSQASSRGEGGSSRSVSNRTIGGEISSGGDRLDVYESVHGRPGISLWSGAESGGFAGSPPRLYKSFREEVEAAARKP